MIRNNQDIYRVLLCIGIFLQAYLGVRGQLPGTDLSASEWRGKQIFLAGKGGAPIVAVISGVDVPATVLPCGSCHGSNGKGNSEGGVQPSDIRWESLIRSYQEVNKEGRKHPPYTEISLKKAVTLGIDPAGNALNKNMPRYKISLADMADLVAYLKRVGNDLDEGLSVEQVKIACLLPPGGMDNDLVKSAAATIRSRFDQLNNGGGIYNRKIEAVFYSETASSGSAVEFLEKERPFALSSCFLPKNDTAIQNYLSAHKIPLCGAIAENMPVGQASSGYIYYLYPDLGMQLNTLLEKAESRTSEKQEIVFVCTESPEDRTLAEQVIAAWTQRHRRKIITITAASGVPATDLASKITALNPEAVLFLGGCELRDLLDAFEANSFSPLIFAPGSSAGRQIFNAPKSFQNKVVLSYPTSLDQVTDLGFQNFRVLQKQYNLPQTFQNTQMTCLAATDLLISSLKFCGKELSREKLLKAIETGGVFHSGLIPDLRFGPNIRVGSTLVFLLNVDIENRSLNAMNY